ncbi:prepilin-type N-terminal cleavage/methylation domain-containing protein [Psychrobium sp. MM17-31]|uniref:prepilin-type N-terminal cleavage/methylation domain-containing protein n=1 Tax=Psychrobium sp. MM17-31 TaxID=2917758 RepID=UPI0023B8404D|nr:prepilin-type N-terminal cleavage/methylation domain-containing protein [Psychrobium sp. MM17-31]
MHQFKNTPNKQQGFTLIELIVVIIILGIIAVTALPKFVNFSTQAHLSVFKSTFGAFKSAMNSQHLLWITRGSPKGTDALNLNGDLDFNSFGLPAGIDDGANVDSPKDCVDIFNSIMNASALLAVPINDGNGIKNLSQDVDIAVTNNSSICYYTFVTESKEVGYNARQFRYLYTTGEVIEWPNGFTLR